jgi:hypothetical protein
MPKHSTTKSNQQRSTKATTNLVNHDKSFTTAKRNWDKSQSHIRALVERILTDEDNDQALALIALIDIITFEKKGLLDRETLAGMAVNHAYTQTLAFGDAALAFRDKAIRLAS